MIRGHTNKIVFCNTFKDNADDFMTITIQSADEEKAGVLRLG